MKIADDPAQVRNAAVTAKVTSLLDSFAKAYGGHSQYRLEDVGRAIAGQINNQGWQEPIGMLAEKAATILGERWEDNREAQDAHRIVLFTQGALQELNAKNKSWSSGLHTPGAKDLSRSE